MLDTWNLLSEELQLSLSREALRRASILIAEQADELAIEMEIGGLADRGGRRPCACCRRWCGSPTMTH